MTAIWQDVLAAVIALAALAWLVRRRLRSRDAACEGCDAGGCTPRRQEETQAAPGPRLVTIEGRRIHGR